MSAESFSGGQAALLVEMIGVNLMRCARGSSSSAMLTSPRLAEESAPIPKANSTSVGSNALFATSQTQPVSHLR
jgi:hypothetical protein